MNLFFRYNIPIEVIPALCFGVASYMLWLSWDIFHFSAMCLFSFGVLLGLIIVGKGIFRIDYLFAQGKLPDKLLIVGFFVAVISHLIGVFLPEVGFDAVWYHLPLTELFMRFHKFFFSPGLAQSGVHRLGSLVFVFPYSVGDVFGVKLFCYLVTLLSTYIFFHFSRGFLSRRIAFLTTFVFFTFHTVAWQASSAYVDQPRFLFEICAAFLLFRYKDWRHVFLAGTLLGFALGTKLLASFFLPAWMCLAFVAIGPKKACVFLVTAFAVVAPWFVQSYMWSGSLIYPLFSTLNGQAHLTHLGYSGWLPWIVHELLLFPFLPILMSLHRESPTTLLYLFAVPYLFIQRTLLWKRYKGWILFSGISLLIWLLIPPLSVRYALSGFAVTLVLCVRAIWLSVERNIVQRRLFFGTCMLSISMTLALRLGANLMAFPYLFGVESYAHYLFRHMEGLVSDPMKQWYFGYWKNYQP